MLTGTESALASAMAAKIADKITAATGQPMAEAAFLKAICDGIAEALVPHLVANVIVLPGIAVATAGSPTAQTGATTAPGQIS